ncbi:UNVERIFIED_CONTAM: hypothetical protein Slati_0215400 [Sesamum latifolium]|uniref:MULE transposase domain-containing protein n=1 Tax=Sesamum latifolium TaxID=2727402 RepID=A0AAW2YBY9_9LAMI
MKISIFFSPVSGYKTVEIFVETKKVYKNVVADDSFAGDWGTYMSMLTENLHSLPAVTQAIDTVGINDDYAGPSTFHQLVDEYFEPEADSFLNNDPVDSEPDEVEIDEEGQNDTDPDDDEVSIPVMLDVLGSNGNESSSHVQQGIVLNIPVSSGPPSLLPVIPFFCTTHPEVPVDSYDIPSSSWGYFYDSNSGELECGMIFKTKAHLIASVQDFSVRFARREYRVVESKSKLWKVACKPCIEGFRYCRNLISIDGTHLYTKYKHKLLVAVTLDANQQILPIAFALVDEESVASWRWFLEMLAKHLMLDDDDRICLISDRHSGLINAINFVPAFTFPRGVHRFCLRHVCSNFNTKYKNIQLKDLCWRAGAEQNIRKFERIMEEIRELNEEAFDWLQKIDREQWTLSYDGGWRTDCLSHDRVKPCITSYKSLITLNNLLLLQQEACRHFGVNASNFIPSYYDIQAFKKTYEGRFDPIWGEEYWDDVDFELVHNPTRRAQRGPGQSQSTWIHNKMDRPQTRARQQYQAHQA